VLEKEQSLILPALFMIMLVGWPLTGNAYDVTDKFSIGGVVSGAYQYQSVDDPSDVDNAGRGALPIQPEFSFTPTDRDEIFAKFGFAAGNGLNEKSPFVLAPWDADLEDDVKDINGRSRDYLLTAWYKHTFQFGGEGSLALSGGIIDATDYLDENAFANDEFTQFMNEVFVNAPNAFLPSYDIGGAFELEYGAFSLKGVGMNVGENDDGNNYNFFGVQLGYTLGTALGEGNYRVIGTFSNSEFLDAAGLNKESRRAVVVSCDQELGEIVGAWIRFGFGNDKAAVDYKDVYSGGINISGKLWGRDQDNAGIGYAYLRGGNTGRFDFCRPQCFTAGGMGNRRLARVKGTKSCRRVRPGIETQRQPRIHRSRGLRAAKARLSCSLCRSMCSAAARTERAGSSSQSQAIRLSASASSLFRPMAVSRRRTHCSFSESDEGRPWHSSWSRWGSVGPCA